MEVKLFSKFFCKSHPSHSVAKCIQCRTPQANLGEMYKNGRSIPRICLTPITPGTTSTSDPDTPLFAGRPTLISIQNILRNMGIKPWKQTVRNNCTCRTNASDLGHHAQPVIKNKFNKKCNLNFYLPLDPESSHRLLDTFPHLQDLPQTRKDFHNWPPYCRSKETKTSYDKYQNSLDLKVEV